jgi:N-alpha-acetyltransferase 30
VSKFDKADFLCQALHPKDQVPIGVIICKLEHHRSGTYRGYIAMLAVETSFRGQGLATRLARQAIDGLREAGADEIVLETEEDNIASLRLYRKLQFLKTKYLHRYYLNGKGAFRLKLPLKSQNEIEARRQAQQHEYDDDLYA